VAITLTLSANAADAHPAVDLQPIVDVQGDVPLGDGLESLELEHHLVAADRQQRRGIAAGVVRDDGPCQAGAGVPDRDGHAREHPAGLVRRDAGDGSGGLLCRCDAVQRRDNQHDQSEPAHS
jgi:hypothetical protein